MRDIETLKNRIQSAEKHNASAELLRNRESDALLDMWHQIRTRFTEQEEEIARYRTRLEEMNQKNVELGRMVDDLLATIEGNLERAKDETVPQITGLAEDLLASEPSPFATLKQSEISIDDPVEPEAQSEIETSSFDDALLTVSDLDDGAATKEHTDQDPEIVRSVLDLIAAEGRGPDDTDADADIENPPMTDGPVAGESLSDGIRDIISRVGNMNAVVQTPEPANEPDPAPEPEPIQSENSDSGPDEFLTELLGNLKNADQAPATDVQRDDALEQELREIESLRNELSGLRDRISTGRENS